MASIGADGFTVTLASNGGEPVTVDEGDGWQGVYRFDRFTVRGDVRVDSADPIRVLGDQVIAGPVETSSISAERLVIEPGAVLTQHTDAGLVVVAGEPADRGGRAGGGGGWCDRRVVAGLCGERELSGSRLAGELTVVGATWARVGCTANPAAETFGSVYYPQENGGGAGTTVGAVVRCGSWRSRVQVDGAIRANGQSSYDGVRWRFGVDNDGRAGGSGGDRSRGWQRDDMLRGFGRWRCDRGGVRLVGVGIDGVGVA